MLTWEDLILPADSFAWDEPLAAWRAAFGETPPFKHELSVVAFSSFGDWFLQDVKNRVWWLDLLEGECTCVAVDSEVFVELLQEAEKQEEWLLASLVEEARQAGKTLQAGQCYGFNPFPRGEATLQVEQLSPMAWNDWQALCLQEFITYRLKKA